MLTAVRWLLVPVAAFGFWCVMFGAGFLGMDALGWFCPPELVISGACTAKWHPAALDSWILVCTAALAFGLVLIPAYVAPQHRLAIAVMSYVAGAAFGVFAVIDAQLWGHFLAAAVGGSLALWLATADRRHPRSVAPHSTLGETR